MRRPEPRGEPVLGFLAGLSAGSRSPLPKHVRLRDALVAAIERGVWQPGDQFPTEAELTRAVPFSLGTVQRAVRSLVDDGFLVRRQGQGSFLTDRRGRLEDPLHCRFLADDGAGYLPVYPRIVRRVRDPRAGPWLAQLACRPQDVLRIDRVIDIGTDLTLYSRFHVDARRFRSLATRPLRTLAATNFKALMRREADLVVTHLQQGVRAAAFPREVVAALGLVGSQVGLILAIVAFAGKGRAVYCQTLYVPASEKSLLVTDGLAVAAHTAPVRLPARGRRGRAPVP